MLNNNIIEYDPKIHRSAIRVPAGACPIKFGQFWDLDKCCPPDTIVCAWFWAVREYGLRRGEFYTAEAIAYWVQYEFDACEGDFDNITSVIQEYARAIGDAFTT